jgi:hypothetical protein
VSLISALDRVADRVIDHAANDTRCVACGRPVRTNRYVIRVCPGYGPVTLHKRCAD